MKYVAVTGINWTDSKGVDLRAEPGEPVPEAVVKRSPWLLKQSLVRAEQNGGGDGTSAR